MNFKIPLYLFLLFVSISFALAQTENKKLKPIVSKFEKYYNANRPDSIFAMYNSAMQSAFSAEKTTEFFQSLKSQAGAIKTQVWAKNQGANSALYNATFERGKFVISYSVDSKVLIDGFYVKPFIEENSTILNRNSTKLQLPFNDTWTVTWGGDTKELNYHVESIAQKNAFDFVVTDQTGKSFKNGGLANDDYYAFGKELFATCVSEVVLVVDGIKDNKPGEFNPIFVTGNTVILKTAANEYMLFAHFKQNTIKVKQGDKVSAGQLLGLCGNSGNSSEPHLHFHIQNVEDMNKATGAKCFFEKILVNDDMKTDYSPIKGEKIQKVK